MKEIKVIQSNHYNNNYKTLKPLLVNRSDGGRIHFRSRMDPGGAHAAESALAVDPVG